MRVRNGRKQGSYFNQGWAAPRILRSSRVCHVTHEDSFGMVPRLSQVNQPWWGKSPDQCRGARWSARSCASLKSLWGATTKAHRGSRWEGRPNVAHCGWFLTLIEGRKHGRPCDKSKPPAQFACGNIWNWGARKMVGIYLPYLSLQVSEEVRAFLSVLVGALFRCAISKLLNPCNL